MIKYGMLIENNGHYSMAIRWDMKDGKRTAFKLVLKTLNASAKFDISDEMAGELLDPFFE